MNRISTKKIGLFDIDSKYHNLALMKLSAWHRQKGDEVEFYKPLWHKVYDKVYASKIFSKPNKKEGYIRKDMYIGGLGFNCRELSYEIEHIKPDYSLYNLNYSLGFTTRGCIRNCEFCIVRKKEGYIKEWAEVEEFLNPKSNIIVLLDNNFLALPSHIKKLQKYIDKGWIMDFNQGLDVRLIDNENAKLIAKIKHYKQIGFSWDFMKDEESIFRGIKKVIKFGIKPQYIKCFILVDFNTTFEEDKYRFDKLWGLGIYPFVMKYQEFNINSDKRKNPKKINDFARWVNRKIFKVCKWEDYKKGILGN